MKNILDIPLLYRAWQAPFVRQKTGLFLDEKDSYANKVVLELGCGPGTNVDLFKDSNYFGFDANARYIETAKSRFPAQSFYQARAEDHVWVKVLNENGISKVDCIFINSLLHHLDDDSLHKTFSLCASVLAANASIHITDLILPHESGIPRLLAKADRGLYPRTLDSWKKIVSTYFKTVKCETFYLHLFTFI
jgi:SAM-dependent methyltransferase